MLGYLSFESVPLTESGLQSGGNGADNDNELLLSLARSNGLSHSSDCGGGTSSSIEELVAYLELLQCCCCPPRQIFWSFGSADLPCRLIHSVYVFT